MFDELDGSTQQFVEQPAAEQQIAEQPKQTESQKEYNFRALRERAEAVERRNAELERLLQMNMSQNQQSTKMQIEEDDDFDVSDDSYIEGKQFKKYVNNLKKELKKTKQQFEEYSAASSLTNAEIRLKSQFNDFDLVVSADNLSKLKDQKPALYRSIMANQDIYDRGYTAYELIKSAGLSGSEYAEQDRKLEENRSKPRAVANANPQSGDTPLARIGDYDRRILSEERKEQLRRQVEEAKRNR